MDNGYVCAVLQDGILTRCARENSIMFDFEEILLRDRQCVCTGVPLATLVTVQSGRLAKQILPNCQKYDHQSKDEIPRSEKLLQYLLSHRASALT